MSVKDEVYGRVLMKLKGRDQTILKQAKRIDKLEQKIKAQEKKIEASDRTAKAALKKMREK